MELKNKKDGVIRESNITQEFVSEVANKLGSIPEVETIFYYLYAVLHSPTFRERYKEFLKIDFPRVPVTSNKKLFESLAVMGKTLTNLHLLGQNPFDESKTALDDTKIWAISTGSKDPKGIADWQVAKIKEEERYDSQSKRVYINGNQFFEGIEPEVWGFQIGGYQVLDKWLSERAKEKRSIADDLKYFMKIAVSLRETIRIMKEIDEAIDAHGGWPIK